MTTLIGIGAHIYSNPVIASIPATGGYGTDFVFTVETTGSAETFTIPCQNVGTFNATIDWGDSSTSTITTFDDADLAHEYATADTYTIRVSGSFPNIYFNNAGDRLKVRSVIQLGDVGWSSLNKSFYGCIGMTSFTAGPCDTSGVTNMESMFYSCSAMTTVDVSGFDTSSVGNMSYMFRDCTSLTSPPDVSGFDTSSVTSIAHMFRSCGMTSPPDVTGWDTSGVTNMGNMFFGCSSMTSPPDCTNFDTAKVTYMGFMFFSCSGMGTIGNIGQVDFDISLVTNAVNMFWTVTMTTAAYDALLIAWEGQVEKTGVAFHAGGSTYTAGGAAATARAALVSNGWTITDGGTA